MQTWARRGLQTALVTGGLLMLGTGIASAHENVSPDRPASPIDGGVSVPVHVGNNALGTPFGQKDLPGVDRTVSTDAVTDSVTGALPQSAVPSDGVMSTAGKLPVALSKAAPSVTKATPGLAKALPALPSSGNLPGLGNLPKVGNLPTGNLPVVGSATSGVTGKLGDLTKSVPDTSSLPAAVSGDSTQALGGDPLLGNRGRVELVAPVDISGNAIALGGPAAVQGNNSHQNVDVPDPVVTGFEPGSLTNNVVAVNYALPVQIANNAVGAIGNATTWGTAQQSATTGGDIVTNGSNRSLSGNVAAGQFATPVQIAGNAVAGGGHAASQSTNSTAGHSNGSILTDGSLGEGSGNVAAAPLAIPAEVDGNALAGAGNAGADSTNCIDTTAGSVDIANAPRGAGPLFSTLPGYLQTSGYGGVLSGNGAVPAAANPIEVAGNAGSLVANTGTSGMTTNGPVAGGYTTTNGQSSAGSGNLAGLPVADPVHLFGNGVAAGGNANGIQANSESATAGGITYANGINGVIAGNDASGPVAGSNDVFGSGASLLGNASGTGTNDVMSTTGGYAGTSGSDATGGGNIVQTPVGLPAEVFGAAASVGGNVAGTVPAESKTITAGGNSNTSDDDGTLSSNVVQTPTSLAGQVFGDAAGLVANETSSADSRTTVNTGGNATGSGRQGTGSGNIVDVPTALPAQVMHNAANLVGIGSAIGTNTTDLGAGGDDHADGAGGSFSGNVVSAPNAGPAQVFGNAVAGLANDAALADNQTTAWAGGDTSTDGTAGAESGNVVTAQIIHTAQVFGNAVAGGGNALGHATNETATASGGAVDTHGDFGSISGDIVDVPATAIAQVFANGVAVVGNTDSLGVNQLDSVAGGPTSTSGQGSLSGLDGVVPLAAVAQIYEVPVQVLGHALVAGANDSQIVNGDKAPAVDVPLSMQNAPTMPQFGLPAGTDALLPANKMPNLATLPLSFPHLALPQFPGLSSLPRVPGLPGAPTMQDLPALPGIPAGLASGLTNLPGGASVLSPLPTVPLVPSLPTGLPTGLPTALPTGLPTGLPGLPGGPSTQDLPAGLPALPMLVAVPSVGHVPGLPALPGLDVPNTSDLSSLPGVSELPSVSNLPVPSMPSLPAVPGAANVPGLDSVPSEVSGFSGDLPLSGTLPSTPSTQSLPEVPLATPATLPFTDGLPTLPVDGLPIGQGVPALPVSLPDVPQVGTLPTVSSGLLPGSPDLLPNEAVPAEQDLPAVGGLPLLDTVLSAPLLATSLPTAGTLPNIGANGLVPTTALPSGLPTNGLADAANLPSLSQLGGTQELPTFGKLPELPTFPAGLTLPGMPTLPSTPHLPMTQSFAVTPGLGGSDLDMPNVDNAVPYPTDVMIGGAPVSSLGDVATSPLAGLQTPGELSSVDAPALSATDSATGSLRNLAGQGLDGVALPSV